MSGILKKNYKYTESAVNQSSSSMHFWGICCESGKQYAQVVGQRFRITMAVLDPKSFQKDMTEKIVSLIVIRNGIEYLLCVLKHGELHQVNLNLIFDKGENVVFYINGYGKVYLSGYQLTDSGDDVRNDENGYLCPLVEVKSKKAKSSGNTESTPRPKKKVSRSDFEASWQKLLSENGDGELDDDDDESDEDFILGEDDDESESSEEEVNEEVDEGELKAMEDDDDDEPLEITQNSQGSRKRKRDQVQSKTYMKNDSLNTSSSSTGKAENISDDEIKIESSSDDDIEASIGNTPMPKKKIKTEELSSEKKKKKKKKRLSEISNISEVEGHQQKLPVSPITPNMKKDGKTGNPIVKLEGGVEMQDVVVGRGPEAKKGKVLHVFYVGRFQDKKIFDSRVPGKKPFSFKLGAQQVIKGWEVGLQGMRVGGRRKLKVPPNMGYGNSKEVGIPPNSTLYFVVELQSIS